jgi:hypothetical protein
VNPSHLRAAVLRLETQDLSAAYVRQESLNLFRQLSRMFSSLHKAVHRRPPGALADSSRIAAEEEIDNSF